MKTAVFVSGGGTNLQRLLDLRSAGELPQFEPVQVIASRAGTGAEQRARAAGLPVAVIRRKDYTSEADYDRALLDCLAGQDIGLVVLAGFLTKLGPDFVAAYHQRIINVHPSLLPAFGGAGFYGLRPHEAVLAYGCKITGATVHLVDHDYDTGPIIFQKAVCVHPDDTPERLQLRVMEEAEQIILPAAVRLFTEGRIKIEGRKTRITEDRKND